MKALLRENLPGLMALACAVTVFLAAALEEPDGSSRPVATIHSRVETRHAPGLRPAARTRLSRIDPGAAVRCAAAACLLLLTSLGGGTVTARLRVARGRREGGGRQHHLGLVLDAVHRRPRRGGAGSGAIHACPFRARLGSRRRVSSEAWPPGSWSRPTGMSSPVRTQSSAKQDMTVRLADGREFVGRLIGSDEISDVALLKIEAAGLPSAVMGDAGALAVGDWVSAIGAPFGLETSLTAGIVSAKRLLPESGNFLFIQTDVAINPGSSGSPLFNLGGQIVGMNSMVYTTSGGYMGVSFAMPIDVVMGIARQLQAHGKVVRGTLGLSVQELSVGLAHAFGLPGAGDRGALVSRVRPGSMAERAGLRLGDIILGFDGRTDMSYAEIQLGVFAKRAGDIAALSVWRSGATRRIDVEVTARVECRRWLRQRCPGSPTGIAWASWCPGTATLPSRGDVGEAGIEVTEVHGAALRAGISAGDRVAALNDLAIRGLEDYDRALATAAAGRHRRGSGRARRPPALLRAGDERRNGRRTVHDDASDSSNHSRRAQHAVGRAALDRPAAHREPSPRHRAGLQGPAGDALLHRRVSGEGAPHEGKRAALPAAAGAQLGPGARCSTGSTATTRPAIAPCSTSSTTCWRWR